MTDKEKLALKFFQRSTNAELLKYVLFPFLYFRRKGLRRLALRELRRRFYFNDLF